MKTPYVKQVAIFAQTGVAATTIAITTSYAAAVGNTVFGFVKTSSGNPVTSVTDSAGNTWSVDKTAGTTATALSIVRSTITNALPAGSTITVNFLSCTGQTAQFVEYLGGWTLDQTLSGQNTTSQLTGSIGPTGTTTSAIELVLSAVSTGSAQGSASYTAPSGYDYHPHGNTVFNAVGYADKYVTATGTQSSTWSWPTTANWAMAIATYAPSGTPPTLNTTAFMALF